MEVAVTLSVLINVSTYNPELKRFVFFVLDCLLRPPGLRWRRKTRSEEEVSVRLSCSYACVPVRFHLTCISFNACARACTCDASENRALVCTL